MESDDRTFDDAPPVKYRGPGVGFWQIFAIVMIPAIIVMLLLPAIQQAKEAARRSHSKNNLIWNKSDR